MRHSLVLLLTLTSAPLCAQDAAHPVSPAMTKAQVTAALGEPTTSRTVSDYTYLFYANTCGRKCGMNDLVVLHSDSVVDAIFRSPNRHYTGKSSSPAAISPDAARRKSANGAAPMTMPNDSSAKKRATPRRMKPAPANDTRPSIPVDPPKIRPVPPPAAKPTMKADMRPAPKADTSKHAVKPAAKTP